MNPNPFGWHVALIPTWGLDAGPRLAIYRHIRDDINGVVTGWTDNGDFIITEVTPGQLIDNNLPLLPRGVDQLIAEAVKPGPNTAELGRLEEALALERQRVDRVLGQFAVWSPPPIPTNIADR